MQLNIFVGTFVDEENAQKNSIYIGIFLNFTNIFTATYDLLNASYWPQTFWMKV